MKKSFLLLLSIFIGNLLLAQNKAQAVDSLKVKQGLAAVALSKQLANYGYSHNQAAALLSAAQIWIDNPTMEKSLSNVKDNEEKTPDAKAIPSQVVDKTPTDFDPKKMLIDAKTMAKDDKNMLALISQAEAKLDAKMQEITALATKGSYSGYIYTTRRVSAYSTYRFSVTFIGGEYAAIVLDGDGDTDLDYYVYDSSGNLVGSDTDGTDYAKFSWYPRYTQEYTFKVVNRGGIYNTFSIICN